MENFIVRIYRRQSDDPDSITGVVEKPDSSESKNFSSIADLIAILAPHEVNPKANRRKQIVEHRKYRRFAVREGTLIFNTSTDVGEIIDIGMGGLSFTCPDIPEESTEPFEVGILCGEDEYFTGKLQCKKIMCHSISGNSVFSSGEKGKKFSIEFGELTPKHRLDLEHIIHNYTHCEV